MLPRHRSRPDGEEGHPWPQGSGSVFRLTRPGFSPCNNPRPLFGEAVGSFTADPRTGAGNEDSFAFHIYLLGKALTAEHAGAERKIKELPDYLESSAGSKIPPPLKREGEDNTAKFFVQAFSFACRYSPFTTLTGLPATNASTLATVLAIRRLRASVLAQAMWGVMMQLRAERRGLLA